MWTPSQDYADRNQIKHFSNRHQREVASCLKNLERVCEFLNNGGTLKDAEAGFGFMGTEGGDIYRIAQTGVPHAKETRLYIYALLTGGNIYVLTIGDKDSQQADLRRCREIVKRIKRDAEQQNP